MMLGKEGYADRRDLFILDGTRDETQRTQINIEHHLEVMHATRSMSKEELDKAILQGLRDMPGLQGKSDDELRELLPTLRKLAPVRPKAASDADERFGYNPDDWRVSDDEIQDADWKYDPGHETDAVPALPNGSATLTEEEA